MPEPQVCPSHGLPLAVLRPHWVPVWTCPRCESDRQAWLADHTAAAPPLPADPLEALVVLFSQCSSAS
jgi:hypothetical protein